MTPAILSALSLAFVTALCCGWLGRVLLLRDDEPGGATNGMWRITMPGVRYYGSDPVVRTAAYAQERIELVLKWAMILLAGNVAVWIALMAGADMGIAISLGVAGGVLAWAFKRVPPVRRWREYVGHAAEVLWVERHSGPRQPGYRASEIERMRTGPRYGDLFKGHDIATGLRRATPVARFMLKIITPAIRRFERSM